MITRAQIAALLLPVLKAVQGRYENQPDQWNEIYTKRKSDLTVERVQQMQFTGFAGIKSETKPMNQDPGMRQKYQTEFQHIAYGISVIISREALDDNQYQKDFPEFAHHLKESLRATKNTICGLFLTDGFTRNMADGTTFFSTVHPYDGGTFSNRIAAGLNETSVNAMAVLAGNMKDESGKPIVVRMEKLIVAPESQFAAERVTKSVFAPDNANNAVNTVHSLGLFPRGYVVNNFINPTLSATPNWFSTTNQKGMYLFQKTEPEFKVVTDEIGTTDNVIAKAYERYSAGGSDPRAMLGSVGS